MTWNWQKEEWPHFTYDKVRLEEFERKYALSQGRLFGVMEHLEDDERQEIVINILSTEGVKTSEIEGELLNRDSVQSSIRRKLGLSTTKNSKIEPAEAGAAAFMTAVYKNYVEVLTHEELHGWNLELMQGRTDLESKGAYRIHEDPMQIVSGAMGMENVHFEAPPSQSVQKEMEAFVKWFNDSINTLPPLTRAGVAHLYFVCIHPYEDGNGRIARALVEKALSQSLGAPALSGLSRQIATKKKAYYDALENNNRELDITDWLVYFAETVLEAGEHTLKSVERVMQKAAVFKKFSDVLNERQIKVLNRMYAAEPEGFAGGLSAENYVAITKTSRATATRDLSHLIELNILKKTGSLRHTRYWLSDVA